MFESIRHESSNPAVPTLFSYSRTVKEVPAPKKAVAVSDDSDGKFGQLYGSSAPMLAVFRLIERVAPSDVSVMIVGESGCGKELIAQTIHEMSSCSDAPFIAINCGALPATLIEAELFGYEKGAFTGANKTHQGFFRARPGRHAVS